MADLVEIVIEDPRWREVPLAEWADRAARAALRAAGLGAEGWQIALLACDDARIRELNARFRGRDAPTNVLSWPAHHLAPPAPGRPPPLPPAPGPEGDSLGDVAIAWETVAAEAAAAGLSLRDHVLHLVLHATLHLLGYDHLDARDAALMEGIETETLVSMGLRDPYSETDPQDGSPFRLET